MNPPAPQGPSHVPSPRPDALEARLLDAVQQAVIATDARGDVIFWNAYAERLFGWTAAEALGRPIVELTPAEHAREDAEAIMANLTRGASWAGEFAVRRKDGSVFTAFVVNSPIIGATGALEGIVGISTDVADQRELEERLRQAAKMEALGRLTAGVAHDFNNLLTIILGNAESLRQPGLPPEDAAESLAALEAAAERAASLTSQLLAFSRRESNQARVVDVRDALLRLRPMLRRLISEDIALEVDAGDEPLPVVLEPVQLDQVIINLCVNARDAMPRGGRLVVRAEASTTPNGRAVERPDGPWIRLSVADTGEGIAPETLPHLFEPFFTTKASGHGTGLGLATIHGIAQRAGGSVTVESVQGAGTVFTVLLPRTTGRVPEDAGAAARRARPRRAARILLVEDDAALRTLTLRMLRADGHDVVATADAEEAETAFAEAHPPFDLVLSDVVMPGASGVQLAGRLLARSPGLPIILMTGYTPDDTLADIRSVGVRTVLEKPFRQSELLDLVQEATVAVG